MLALVALLHLAVGWWWWQLKPPRPDAPPAAPRVMLLRWLSPPRPRAHRDEPPPPARHVSPAVLAPRKHVAPAEPSISVAPMAAPASQAAPPRAAEPPPLQLALPRERIASEPPDVRGQALNDPRVHQHLSYSERFAQTLGTDQTLHEEAMGDGVRQYRKGNRCYIVHEARAAQIDPFNSRNVPKLVHACR
jgi:hypothetical protein